MDGIDRYRRALTGFDEVVAGTPDGAWDDPSPCPGWTARDVVGHMVGAQHVLLGMLTGTAPEPAPDRDPIAEWAGVRDRVRHELDEPGLASRTLDTPLGTLPAPDMLDASVVEPLVHAWDLAVATGREHSLDPELAEHCMAVARRYAALLRKPGMFGPERDGAEHSGAGERLLAFLGREP